MGLTPLSRFPRVLGGFAGVSRTNSRGFRQFSVGFMEIFEGFQEHNRGFGWKYPFREFSESWQEVSRDIQ